MRVEPNPSFGRVQFVSEGAGGRVEAVEILDLQGRVVRALAPPAAGAAVRFAWDGRDARGVRVPAGVYQARIHRGGRTELTRVVLLP